jgi:alkylation response protein AidB-like acyl-CoA dehydrogenase
VSAHPRTAEDARRTVREWLARTLPTDDVDAWQIAFLRSPLSTPGWPQEYGGLGLDPEAARAVDAAVAASGAPVPYTLVGMRMIGATILHYGSEDQRRRYLPRLSTREDIWSQLFSEPGAGSDLASLSTRAVRDGDGWLITGQKVWATFSADARYGLALTRTDTAAAKQRGITAFVIDMSAPGVTVRPIRQMTGDTRFSEIFLQDVRVGDDARLGEVDGGWSVATFLLSSERGLLGGGASSPVGRIGGIGVDEVLARYGRSGDPLTEDRLVSAWLRACVVDLLGDRVGGRAEMAPLVKLARTTGNRDLQELALDLAGLPGMVGERPVLEDVIVNGFLHARANTIAGGTSEVVRTLIGERLLGLPREPDPYRGKPWAEVPRS